jgi:hypothetical protein
MADSGKKTIMQSMMQSALDAQSAAEIEKEKKKPVKVIKKGDMSPETKALPDEVVKPPKGIGESEKDMDPIPAKKKGGMIKKMAGGGKVSQLAKANGCAVRGKTRGKIC